MTDSQTALANSAGTWAVRAEGLHLRAGGRDVLHLDRLALPAGQTTVIFGPNGAGKTTLLRSLLGFHRSAAGRLEVLGEPVRSLRGGPLARFRRRVGYVPQLLVGRGEMPLTVREVVAIGRTGLGGLGTRLTDEDWREVDNWLDRLGLSDMAGRAYGELSGGEQRRALIAKAMAKRPQLLLLDEPTANLDLRAREQIVSILSHLLLQADVTGVLVCHEPEVIPPGTGHMVLLANGRAVAAGAPGSVLSPQRLAELYGPGFSVICRGGRFAMVPSGPEEPA